MHGIAVVGMQDQWLLVALTVRRRLGRRAHCIVKSVTCLVLFHHKRAWHGAGNCWQQATPAPGSHSGDRSATPSDGPGGGPAALHRAVSDVNQVDRRRQSGWPVSRLGLSPTTGLKCRLEQDRAHACRVAPIQLAARGG